MSLLTEQEITEIVREAARGSATRRDGSTSQRIARAIESKVIEKIKAQGFAGYWNGRETVFFEHELLGDKTPFYDVNIPLYKLPEGD